MPRLISLLVAVVVVLTGIFTSLPLLRQKAAQKRAFLQLQEDVRVEQLRAKELSDKIQSVRSDRKTVERLAREKFGLGRSGETIFKFRPDLPPVSPPPAAAPRSAPAR